LATEAIRAFALAFIAAALTSCGGLQSASGGSNFDPAVRGASWMLPEAHGRDLLYLSGKYGGNVSVYTFPGGELAGGLSLGGGTWGLCSNKGGDVFITSQYAIYEYPHGRATAVATLTDPLGSPNGCSVDPTTGNLAVISDYGVAIFRPGRHHHWHLPRMFYMSPTVAFGGYDGSGNLFVDGEDLTGSNTVFFLELPKGGVGFESVTLKPGISGPGNIEWDGQYLAVGDEYNLTIHRYAISGSEGEQVGQLSLNGPQEVGQFWIQDGILIGPAFLSDKYYVGLWQYPGGGASQGTLAQSDSWGATVSAVRK
jgi:hypothetical protein